LIVEVYQLLATLLLCLALALLSLLQEALEPLLLFPIEATVLVGVETLNESAQFVLSVSVPVALTLPVSAPVTLAIPVDVSVTLTIPVDVAVPLTIPVDVAVTLTIPVDVAVVIPIGLGASVPPAVWAFGQSGGSEKGHQRTSDHPAHV
jgi:hypothetical protein